MPRLLPKLFIIMPFGTHPKNYLNNEDGVIDFNSIYENIIAKAGQEAGYQVLRIDEVSTPGRISDQYLRELYSADVVVADVTIPNANVFYELGIRQSVAAGPTLLIAHHKTDLPFDLKDQRVLLYDPDSPSSMEAAVKRVKAALSNIIQDPGTNPVQSFLQQIGATPNPVEDKSGFEQNLRGRIDRARNVNQLVAVWSWAQQYRPLPPFTLFYLAECLANKGEWSIAAEVVQEAIEARPNDFELHRQYAWYLRKLGPEFYSQAEKSFHTALKLNPADPETLGMLGGLYKRQERFIEAAEQYARGAKISPSNFYMKVNQAGMELLADPTKPQKAISLYNALYQEIEHLEIHSRDEWSELICGEAQFVTGNFSKAKKHFLKALQMSTSAINLLSPADQIELFGRKGFRTKDAAEIADFLRSIYQKKMATRSFKLEPPIKPTTVVSINLPVIIHLSDIHFGLKFDTDGKPIRMHRFKDSDYSLPLDKHLLNEFTSTRRHFDINNMRLFLVVSGDLTYTATANEFEEVGHFLTKVSEGLGIPKERIIICPGNHDVDWASSKIDLTHRFDNYLSFLSNFYGLELFHQLYPLVQWDFRVNSKRPEPTDIMSLSVFQNERLTFLALNSCVYETEEHHYGYVSGKQLRNLEHLLEKTSDNDNSVRIAILHHHLHPFPEPVELTAGGEHWHDQSTIRDSALVEKFFERNLFDIVLHGHKHKAQIRETVVRDISLDDDVSPLIVCGAGSCGVQSNELEHSVPNQYEVLEMLNVPRIRGADFLKMEWREIALTPGAEWVTPKTWTIRG